MVQRQKLELEVNKPVKIELLYDEPITGENQYGNYSLYAVKVEGSEYAFFPNAEVHESLKQLKAGDKAVVTKLATQRGKKMVAKYDVAINGNSATSTDKASDSQISEDKEKVVTDSYSEIMLQSLKDGLEISNEISGLSLDHIIRISLSLFIQRTKNGSNY